MTKTNRPMLLDLFCGAGGATQGYIDAGFHVTGVDVVPHWNYSGDDFVCADALSYFRDNYKVFAAVHASPPCQLFSAITHTGGDRSRHKNYIPALRHAFLHSKLHFVIENVPGCPLIHPLTLCGSMFGLKVRRHRLFECSFRVPQPSCDHPSQGRVVGVYGNTGGRYSRMDKLQHTARDWRQAMGIHWMNTKQLSQAIPPAYTSYIGRFLYRLCTFVH